MIQKKPHKSQGRQKELWAVMGRAERVGIQVGLNSGSL